MLSLRCRLGFHRWEPRGRLVVWGLAGDYYGYRQFKCGRCRAWSPWTSGL